MSSSHWGLYRKKPIQVHALQWNPTETPASAIPPGCRLALNGHDLLITTLEGEMRCEPGSWLVIGVKGEPYPIRPDIFEMTYEAVE